MWVTQSTYVLFKPRQTDFPRVFCDHSKLVGTSLQCSLELSILMITLYTSGSKYSKKRCEGVVEWFCNKYLRSYKIEIEVLHRGLLREGVYGWCDIIGKTHNPRIFLIEIHNKLNNQDYIKTLLHELVHVQQFVLGDLKIKSSKRYYKGICMEDVEYENQGHEIEANIMEEVLYDEYLTHP